MWWVENTHKRSWDRETLNAVSGFNWWLMRQQQSIIQCLPSTPPTMTVALFGWHARSENKIWEKISSNHFLWTFSDQPDQPKLYHLAGRVFCGGSGNLTTSICTSGNLHIVPRGSWQHRMRKLYVEAWSETIWQSFRSCRILPAWPAPNLTTTSEHIGACMGHPPTCVCFHLSNLAVSVWPNSATQIGVHRV